MQDNSKMLRSSAALEATSNRVLRRRDLLQTIQTLALTYAFGDLSLASEEVPGVIESAWNPRSRSGRARRTCTVEMDTMPQAPGARHLDGRTVKA